MMQRDLATARKAWLAETDDNEERKRREESDFLIYQDNEGEFACFHSTRHTFITNLSRVGVSPQTAQKLARHSDIRLTMNVQSHTDLAEEVDAIGRLPQAVSSTNVQPSNSSLPRSDAEKDGAQRNGSAPEAQAGRYCNKLWMGSF
jgi:hypothetical protein